jgi:hypothetical protein
MSIGQELSYRTGTDFRMAAVLRMKSLLSDMNCPIRQKMSYRIVGPDMLYTKMLSKG